MRKINTIQSKNVAKNNNSNLPVIRYGVMVLMPILSILRMDMLVYVQIGLCLLVAVLSKNKAFVFGVIVSAIFGSYFAPMDQQMRFNGEYPSLHTMRVLGFFKGIDVLTFIIGFFILKTRAFSFGGLGIKFFLLTTMLVLCSVMSTLSYLGGRGELFDFGVMLYVLRGAILWFLSYLILRKMSCQELATLAMNAILICIVLMLLSIIFPHQNPLVRNIFGFEMVVAFAGDEYGSIGLLTSVVLICGRSVISSVYLVNTIAFVLAVLAGRKASISYFAYVFILILSTRYLTIRKFRWMLITEHFSVFMGLLLLSKFNSNQVQEAFEESLAIFASTVDSIQALWTNTPISAILGIGPFSKYQIINLEASFDHSFSFGQQAGDEYRFKLWFLPFDRAIINFGLISVVAVVFLIKRFIRRSPSELYIALWTVYPIMFVPCSTNMLISLAIAWAAMQARDNDGKRFVG